MTQHDPTVHEPKTPASNDLEGAFKALFSAHVRSGPRTHKCYNCATSNDVELSFVRQSWNAARRGEPHRGAAHRVVRFRCTECGSTAQGQTLAEAVTRWNALNPRPVNDDYSQKDPRADYTRKQ